MNIIIVGAGISGLVLALLLEKEDHQVQIYDKRSVFDEQVDGRSINFTISGRGLAVLTQLGLSEIVLAHAAVLTGRILHLQNTKAVRYQYGTQNSQVLLSIRRSVLIDIILNKLKYESHIQFQAGFELINIDETTMTCDFFDVNNSKNVTKQADAIIGADGVFSTVRSFMLKKQMSSYQQTVFNWGYKEYQFDCADAEKLQLCSNHMHMWPKSSALLVSIPNKDKTHSVIFTAPILDKLGNKNNFDELVKREFPDVISLAHSFLNKCGQDAYNYLVSIKIDKWHLDSKIMLIGDACHATYPFYGQGMNSALEDAVMLSNYINNKSLTRLDAFIAYEKLRKNDTNALHKLSEAHLHHMTKAMISPFWQSCNMLDFQIAKLFPKKWVYEYEIVAHSTISYNKVLDIVKKQNTKKFISGFYIIASLLSIFIKLKKWKIRNGTEKMGFNAASTL